MERLEHSVSYLEQMGNTELLPQKYFDAYRDANLTFPQRSTGIAVLIADAVLSDPDFDPVKFAHSRFSDDQLHDLKKALDATHEARGVAAATADTVLSAIERLRTHPGMHPKTDVENFRVITDDRLHRLWEAFKRDLLGALSIVAEGTTFQYVRTMRKTDKSDNVDQRDAMAEHLQQRLADTRIRNETHLVFGTLAEYFMSDAGLAVAKEIREVAVQKDKAKLIGLYHKLFKAGIARYRQEHGKDFLSADQAKNLGIFIDA